MPTSDRPEPLFTKKLRRAIGDLPKALIDTRAGLPDGSVSVYLYRKTIPQPDAARKLAKGLGVPLEWLINEEDESLDPPPPPPPKSVRPALEDVSTGALLMEVARRYRRTAVDMHTILANLETKQRPWLQWAITAWCSNFAGQEPPNAAAKFEAVLETERVVNSLHQGPDMGRFCTLYHDELPGAELDPAELLPLALQDRYRRICETNVGYDAFLGYAKVRARWRAEPESRKQLEIVQGRTVAFLLTRPEVINEKRYDKTRKELQKAGYLTAEMKPKEAYRVFLSEPVPN